MAQEPQNIVVLGGGFAGVGLGHYLLRHTIPAVTRVSSSPTTYKVLIVSPSTQFYWPMASPRAMVNKSLMPLEKLFASVPEGFKSYAKDAFEFVHGKAVSMDYQTCRVEVELAGSKERISIPYHALIIATGASSKNPLWSAKDGEEVTKAAFHEMYERLPKAKSVVVGGGGPAGIETSAEMGAEYGGSKEITLISATSRLLEGRLRPSLGDAAAARLKQLGVNVRHNTRVESVSPAADGTTTLTLSDGTMMATDIYIDATGLRPNTSFVPAALLNPDSGRVEVDLKTLRVKDVPRVYAIGPAAAGSDGTILDIWRSTGPLMSNVEYDLSEGRSGKPKEYQRWEKETLIVPLGRKGGIGAFLGWKLPSMMVWMVKGRSYMTENVPRHRDGRDV